MNKHIQILSVVFEYPILVINIIQPAIDTRLLGSFVLAPRLYFNQLLIFSQSVTAILKQETYRKLDPDRSKKIELYYYVFNKLHNAFQ